jgi:predicted negative regulator of RcsB-dependent stress response
MSGLYIYVVIFGAILVITGGLYAWAKYQGYRADKAEAKAKAAEDTAKSAQIEIAQTSKIAEAVATVKDSLVVEQKAGQAKLDTGDRSFLDKDIF